MELKSQLSMYDVKFTTMPFKFPAGTENCLNIFPLITGLNAAMCKKQIKDLLIKAANE